LNYSRPSHQGRAGTADAILTTSKPQAAKHPIYVSAKAVAKFQQGMERLRAEAIKRKLQARQFK
jgi:hypothetical protein